MKQVTISNACLMDRVEGHLSHSGFGRAPCDAGESDQQEIAAEKRRMCDRMTPFRIALWLRLAAGPDMRAASKCFRSRNRRPSGGGWLVRQRSNQNSTVKRPATLTGFLLVLVAISYSQSADARLESARRLKQQGTLPPALQAYEAYFPASHPALSMRRRCWS